MPLALASPALLAASALAADALPRFGPGTASHLEVRGGTAIVQAAGRVPYGRGDGWGPNLHATAWAGAGLSWLRAEAGLHVAGERVPWGALEGRIEPRAGIRLVADPVFVGVGLGASLDSGGFGGVGLGSVGWIGPGDRVRPVVAVDGRWAPQVRYDIAFDVDFECFDEGCEPIWEPPPIRRYGGQGVLVSFGVQWARRNERVARAPR